VQHFSHAIPVLLWKRLYCQLYLYSEAGACVEAL